MKSAEEWANDEITPGACSQVRQMEKVLWPKTVEKYRKIQADALRWAFLSIAKGAHTDDETAEDWIRLFSEKVDELEQSPKTPTVNDETL